MPNSAEHRAKYEANRNLLDTGNNGTPLSTLDGCWAAIVAFYAALHLVDRLAARVNSHPAPPGAHSKRLRFVANQHRVIFVEYNDLKVASEIARYGTLNQFQRAFPGTTVQDILININLVAIETYVDSIFNPPAPPATTGS
ncbi:MAG TPA: hypothetical protein VEL76_22305 [Gemmataceae bacterium]|nr:hypothetical protein [Gemmataceae bacterium]